MRCKEGSRLHLAADELKSLWVGPISAQPLIFPSRQRISSMLLSYAVHKGNSYRGKQSAAEACAKHLKERIENPPRK